MLNRSSKFWQTGNRYSMALAHPVQVQLHSIKFHGASWRSGKILPLVMVSVLPCTRAVLSSRVRVSQKALANFMWAGSISKFTIIGACFDEAPKCLVVTHFSFFLDLASQYMLFLKSLRVTVWEITPAFSATSGKNHFFPP